jgi:hypothetical protein
MSQEEKAYRAAASIGLSKEEKRKVQNKLAQRAFRERSKLKNRAVCVLLLANELTSIPGR